MSWFNEEVAAQAEEVYKQRTQSLAGEHIVTIKNVYIIGSSSSKAQAFKVEFEYESGYKGDSAFWFIDKETGTQVKPDGKPTFGSKQLKDFFGAIKTNPNSIKPTKTTIKVFGEDKEVPLFRELFGRPVRIVVQMKEEEHYQTGEIEEKPEVIGWYDVATRKSAKEISENTDAKEIEDAIKRSQKVRKHKEKKEETKPKSQGSEAGNPWA